MEHPIRIKWESDFQDIYTKWEQLNRVTYINKWSCKLEGGKETDSENYVLWNDLVWTMASNTQNISTCLICSDSNKICIVTIGTKLPSNSCVAKKTEESKMGAQKCLYATLQFKNKGKTSWDAACQKTEWCKTQ